jgi:hypothetical protein
MIRCHKGLLIPIASLLRGSPIGEGRKIKASLPDELIGLNHDGIYFPALHGFPPTSDLATLLMGGSLEAA